MRKMRLCCECGVYFHVFVLALFLAGCGSSGTENTDDGRRVDSSAIEDDSKTSWSPKSQTSQPLTKPCDPEKDKECGIKSDSIDGQASGFIAECRGEVIYETGDPLNVKVCKEEVEDAYRGMVLSQAAEQFQSLASPKIQGEIESLSKICSQNSPQNPSYAQQYEGVAIVRELLLRNGTPSPDRYQGLIETMKDQAFRMIVLSLYTGEYVSKNIDITDEERSSFYTKHKEELEKIKDINSLRDIVTQQIMLKKIPPIQENEIRKLREEKYVIEINDNEMTISIDDKRVVEKAEGEAAYEAYKSFVSLQGSEDVLLDDASSRYDFLNQYTSFVLMRRELQNKNLYDEKKFKKWANWMAHALTLIWLQRKAIEIESRASSVSDKEAYSRLEFFRSKYPGESEENLIRGVKQQLLLAKAQKGLVRKIQRIKDRSRVRRRLVWCE